MRITPLFLALVFAGAGLASGTAPAQTQLAAQFEHQVTGVTVSERGRIFVDFPCWTEDSAVEGIVPEGPKLVTTDGKPLRSPDGRKLLSAADSIALSSDDAWLYWKPLTGNTPYRIRTAALTGRGLAGEEVSSLVRSYGRVGQDPRLRWTDTSSQGADGSLYVTASRIQDSVFFNRDAPLALPTRLWPLRRLRD